MTEKPYLSAFFFCERVLQEQDGVPSVVRIIDIIGLNQLAPEGGAPATALMMFIAFKNRGYQGLGEIQIAGTRPSGKPLSREALKLEFQPNRGQNVVVNAQLSLTEEGTYWFDLYLDGQLLTKTPLTVALTKNLSAVQAPAAKQERSPSATDDARREE